MPTEPTVLYFLSTQEWRTESPHEIISQSLARSRKKSGLAYFIPGTNGVMCEVPPNLIPSAHKDVDGQPLRFRCEWKIMNQTPRPGVRHKSTRIGPGAPYYAMV